MRTVPAAPATVLWRPPEDAPASPAWADSEALSHSQPNKWCLRPLPRDTCSRSVRVCVRVCVCMCMWIVGYLHVKSDAAVKCLMCFSPGWHVTLNIKNSPETSDLHWAPLTPTMVNQSRHFGNVITVKYLGDYWLQFWTQHVSTDQYLGAVEHLRRSDVSLNWSFKGTLLCLPVSSVSDAVSVLYCLSPLTDTDWHLFPLNKHLIEYCKL